MSQERNPSNHLAEERSLYLRQHAANPVDWFPWGEEAFEKARAEDKPIFLSIGYSACHWCHVMAHESFEDEYVASVMNKQFLAIKVDKEERPDVDGFYMAACQLMTGGGGWPLTIVMTPDKRPFFAASFIPKDGRPGAPGLVDILMQLGTQWKLDRAPLLRNAEQVIEVMRQYAARREAKEVDPEVIDLAVSELIARYDEDHGGFAVAPKFPEPHRLILLTHEFARSGRERLIKVVRGTLDGMMKGTLQDQVGFGFHRYSTDPKWHLPHFEKMLYDQALLGMAFAEAYQATHEPRYAEATRHVLAYVARDLTSPYGGFFSAEGADSEGEEGRFYTWTEKEIEEALNGVDRDLFLAAYEITADGNYREEASRQRVGRNVLHLSAEIEMLSQRFGLSREGIEGSLTRSLALLFDLREKRVRPDLDDKILTDWNGLMVAACAIASRSLGDRKFVDMGRRALDLIGSEMHDPQGRLLHRLVGTKAGIPGMLDDYAYLGWGFLEMYRATLDLHFLEEAKGLMQRCLEHFADPVQGGLFQTADDSQDLPVRLKAAYDGAVPSGNSVAATNLVSLADITGEDGLRDEATRIVNAFAEDIEANPRAFAHMLQAIARLSLAPIKVALCGPAEDPRFIELRSVLDRAYCPEVAVLAMDPSTGSPPLFQDLPPSAAFPTERPFACIKSKGEWSGPLTSTQEMMAALQAALAASK